jgi:protein involved in polysaccharide export with SLBB domain
VLFFRRPDWEAPRVVTITGEVKYPGSYTLKNKSETIRDLVQRAGGLTRDANADGATFSRAGTGTTYASGSDLLRGAARVAADVAPRVRIGVDLGTALKNATAPDNLILQAGDELAVPQLRQTVDIRGEVNAPTVTALARGKPLSHYIRAGGGPTTNASTRRAYVVQPNGKVEARRRLLWTFDLDPTPRAGATVVVPVRDTTTNRAAAMASVSMFAQLVASLAAVWAITRN